MFFLKNLIYLKKDMSLKEFSRITDIPYRTLQDIFKNEASNPKIETLLKLRKCFNVSIDDLLLKDLEKEE